MISHNHKCVFVHIPKAAGTSIEMSFLEDLGLDMDNRHALLLGENTNKNFGPRRISHLLAEEYVEQYFISDKLFKEYYKFSFVRNPYDRLYSTYKFLGFSDYLSFDAFILNKLDFLLESREFGFFLKPQYDYLYKKNECLVDFVGKFEDLNKDFEKIKLNINRSSLSLKHYNKTKRPSSIFRKIKIIGKAAGDLSSMDGLSFSKEKVLSSKGKEKFLHYYLQDFKTFSYDQEICLI